MSQRAEQFFSALYAGQTGVLELRTFDHGLRALAVEMALRIRRVSPGFGL